MTLAMALIIQTAMNKSPMVKTAVVAEADALAPAGLVVEFPRVLTYCGLIERDVHANRITIMPIAVAKPVLSR